MLIEIKNIPATVTLTGTIFVKNINGIYFRLFQLFFYMVQKGEVSFFYPIVITHFLAESKAFTPRTSLAIGVTPQTTAEL
jgi:uncharacterized membrane protein